MSNIMEYLNKIKKAVYGEEVRQSIHDAIQQCYYDGKAGAVDLEARQLLEAKADKTDVSTPYNFKGNCLFSELPAEGNSVNDTYYCTDMKCKYTWNSEAWYQSGLSEKEYVDELAQLSESMNENVSQLSGDIADLEKCFYLVKSKNLFDYTKAESDRRIGGGDLPDVVSGWCTSDYINVSDSIGRTVYFSVENHATSIYRVGFYDKDKHRVLVSNEWVTDIIVPEGAYYMRFSYNKDLAVYTTIQAEYDALTFFEKYFEPYFVIKSENTEHDGVFTKKKSRNLFNKYGNLSVNKRVGGTANLEDAEGFTTSDYIDVSDGVGKTIYFGVESHSTWILKACFYDKNKAYVKATTDWIESAEVPQYAHYMRFTYGNDLSVYNTIQAEYDYVSPFEQYYEPYYKLIDKNIQLLGMPIFSFTGDISNMDKENSKNLSFVYRDKNGTITNGYVKMKWQGTSSLAYPKKNYTITMYGDSDMSNKLNVELKSGWGEQSKYCLKANYVDHTHALNIVGARLWGQGVASRNSINDTLKNSPNYGAIDGFPCIVYVNGEYQGLYTCNIPKEAWMFNMGSGTNECVLCGEIHDKSGAFREPALLDGSDWSIEYITDENNTEWAKTSFNNFIDFVMNNDDDAFKNGISNHADVESLIDYLIYVYYYCGFDSWEKNCIFATYDGVHWIASMYDMDTIFGGDTTGKNVIKTDHMLPELRSTNIKGTTSLLWFKVMKNFKSEIKSRLEELREDSGTLSFDNIYYEMCNFTVGIPQELFVKETEYYPTIPSTSTRNVHTVLDYMNRRLVRVDSNFEKIFG